MNSVPWHKSVTGHSVS